MKIGFWSKRLLLAGVALLSCCSDANAQMSSGSPDPSAGSSDRTDGAFEVPGWFSKDQSDIARYPVPLQQPQAQQPSDPSPLVVIQKSNGVTSKQIWTPTAYGGFYAPKNWQPTPVPSLVPMTTPSLIPRLPSLGAWGGGSYIPGIGGVGSYIPGIGGMGLGSIPYVGGLGGVRSFIPGIGGMGFGGTGFGSLPYAGGVGGFGGYIPGGIGVNRVQQIIVPPSKPVSNYYTPVQTGNSGNGYYSSNTPVVPAAPVVTIPPKQSPKEYWGDTGNPFGNNLNSTPW